MNNFEETVVFIVHSIKQFCFGFEKMNEISEQYSAGSAGLAFFMSAIYQQLSIFYLIDKKDKPMGGAFYPALKNIGYEHLLDPIKKLFDTPLGSTTFGEVIRVFRNKVIVHNEFIDSDLDCIYKKVDMKNSDIQKIWQDLLLKAYVETKLLAINLAKATGRPLSDFGMTVLEELED